MDWAAWVRNSARARFPLVHVVQTNFGVQTASYQIGNVDLFLAGKAAWDVKLTTQLRLMSRSKMVELYLHSLISFHCKVFN
jgi:hypothetical protein